MKEFTVTFPQTEFNTISNLLQLICVAGLRLNGTGNAIPTDEQLHAVWRILATAGIKQAQNSDRASELEYLQFYVRKIEPCLGPGSDDVNQSIEEEFVKKTGKRLPVGYELAEKEA